VVINKKAISFFIQLPPAFFISYDTEALALSFTCPGCKKYKFPLKTSIPAIGIYNDAAGDKGLAIPAYGI